jgi:hypothetical protein
VALAAAAIAWFTIERHADGPPAAPPAGAHASAPAAAGFHPTIEHTVPAPAAAPDGMVWIPGGEFAAAVQPFQSIPMLLLHGEKDSIIPPTVSRRSVMAL